ncbi:hypothetical protein TWF191_007777 [Orbilia oligospora]|uniref:DUF427 domain-containing protein n=1 Tax=Orbilia oligospora TaxID=2813651 RepID=A0A7C8V2Z5_ORBOL|nr:hypothetical protein TWF191_007777 [Orbilia oligospora]
MGWGSIDVAPATLRPVHLRMCGPFHFLARGRGEVGVDVFVQAIQPSSPTFLSFHHTHGTSTNGLKSAAPMSKTMDQNRSRFVDAEDEKASRGPWGGNKGPGATGDKREQGGGATKPSQLESSDFIDKTGTHKPGFPKVGHYEVCEKRVRAWHLGALLFDTERAIYVWENIFFPTLYIHRSSLFNREDEGFPLKKYGGSKKDEKLLDLLSASGLADLVESDLALFVHKKYVSNVILVAQGRLKDHIRIPFKALDEWREHEDVIIGFPRDPYKGISLNHCLRSIEIQIDTDKFESSQAIVLSQKGYPPRFYFTRDIFKSKLPSGRKLSARDPRKNGRSFFCPYKGHAEYFNMTINGSEYENICWRFTQPPPDLYEIKGRFCFRTCMLTSMSVDGVPLTLESLPENNGLSEEDLAMFFYDV